MVVVAVVTSVEGVSRQSHEILSTVAFLSRSVMVCSVRSGLCSTRGAPGTQNPGGPSARDLPGMCLYGQFGTSRPKTCGFPVCGPEDQCCGPEPDLHSP
ncbi:hypothetical protein E2C01_014957 [Portunus trituberculatus]|uniref:Uncharacterized protein n=1 Tax=Portunus trituberculatus TaxID=210409 RepID=A0A5B7DLI5_PORTR|nr:hypothetical protein [Portunus trituberculatus]